MLPMASATPPVPADASREPRTFLVPHTHWDREWYQPFDEFLERLVEMMDGLIEVLSNDERFGHFHLDGQTAMIDDYLAVRPERLPDIERLVRAGRLSVGPWFTQMDEFLTSGESMIRNLERGTRRAAELTGEPVGGLRAGYLPDQFGHIGQMPQILANGGFERAVVWRGVPNEIDRTAFTWEAPDGSRVLAEYLIWGYSLGLGIGWAQDAEGIGTELRKAIDWIAPHRAYPDRVLVEVGSDHQGPAGKLPPLLPEVNEAVGARAEIGSIAAYLDAPDPEGIPTWRGELRSSARTYLLPGVYSTRAHQKETRARVETLLERWAEPFSALVPGVDWPAAELEEGWRLLLWNGAHDSVCGCSVDHVAADVDARYARAESLGEDVARAALGRLAGRMAFRGWMHVNPSPFERQGVPGLGWRVRRDELPSLEPVPLLVDGEDIVAADVRVRLVDEGDVGDLYNFCPTEEAPACGPDALRALPDGSVAARFPGATVEVRAEDGDAALVLDLRVRNDAPDHRLRLHVALVGPANGSVAMAPFQVVERPLRSEGGTEPPSPTWPARGAVSAGGISVFRLGVFEYEVLQDPPALAVALLRCVGTISRPGFDTRRGPAGPDIATPDAQMVGEHAVRLTIRRGVAGDDLPRAWEEQMLPLRSVRTEGGGDLPDRGSAPRDRRGRAVVGPARRRRLGRGTDLEPLDGPRTARVADREVSSDRPGSRPFGSPEEPRDSSTLVPSMQTTVEETDKHVVRLSVEVPSDEVARDLDMAYRKVAREVKIPGFRKGKVPRQIIDARIGREHVVHEFLDEFLPEYYLQAVRENDLAPIADPEIDMGDVEDGKPLTFTATVEVRPRLTLEPTQYKGVHVEAPYVEPTEQEIDEYVDRLRDRYAELEVVSRPARTGDYVIADVQAHVHDRVIPEATQSNFMTEVGSTRAGARAGRGARGNATGEILKFNATLPDSFGEAAGEEVAFQVLVKEVKAKKLPEATTSSPGRPRSSTRSEPAGGRALEDA